MDELPPFDWALPYPSRRSPVLAANVVATSQPLAVAAGLAMLERGGNAVDAALAMAIALTVVEPTNNGVGADAFAVVWDGSSLHGLNGSGRSAAALDPARFAVMDAMPLLGWDPVTVPGAVSAWGEISARFGRLEFAALFEPAIAYADRGFLVSPVVAQEWALVAGLYAGIDDFARAFLPDGCPPRAGELFRHDGLASTLREIAEGGGRALYSGELGARIAEHARLGGADLAASDLAAHRSEWVEPLSICYRGFDLHELPPNGQGLAALVALGILEHFELESIGPISAEGYHLQIEAMKLALADAHRYLADPEAMDIVASSLLSADYLAARASLIDPTVAKDPGHAAPAGGDTVYLAAADEEGLIVSYIQSNYFAFGSGVVVPGTGISLQNRGACFSLTPGHPNRVGPRKRPFNTIIPAFVSRQERPVMAFGVMGGAMQPQGHVQMMVRLADLGENPQAAIDAPRWQVTSGLEVAVEAGFPDDIRRGLADRGHRLRELEAMWFGGAQAVACLADGYLAASEPRKDGHAAGF